MFARSSDAHLTVQIPVPSEDRPQWSKIGVITLIGFVVGVAWPRVLGVRVGAHLPQSAPLASIAAADHELGTKPGSSAAVPSPSARSTGPLVRNESAALVAPPASSASASAVSVSVGRGAVASCKTSDGESLRGADCGRTPALDRVVARSLQKLAECPSASASADKLHLVVRADYSRGSVSLSTRKTSGSEALVACARSAVEGISLDGVAHRNPIATVAYTVTLDPAASSRPTEEAPAPRGDPATVEAGQTTEVVWDVAIVRDAPRTGHVVARLKQGTALHVGPSQDGWFPIKFGDNFATDGWVYGAAIGR